ncbi:MAG: transporter substrate-binding domain-containing protein [Geobacteraceae bacterium]|nr:transporter substrate-binding domain-containing protein [Geobacteraceae bacterium]
MNKVQQESRPKSDSAFFGFFRGGTLSHITIAFLALLFIVSAEIRPVKAASDGTVSLSTQEWQWLSQHDGRIRIGITVIPPQILRENGVFTGLSIDYIRLLEQKLGCRFTLVPYATWNEVIQAAKTRQIDMIFAAQSTPERQAYLLFTEPYIELPNMIVVRKDRQGGSSLKEMKGWSVATSEGSAVHEYLQKEHGYLDLRPVHDELSGLMKLSLGEVDAMVVEISRASYYIEKAGILNLRVAGNAGLTYRLRFAVRNDWPVLCGILDKGLSAITTKEKKDISRRWIIVGEKSMFASRTFWISLAAIAGGVVLAIAVVIIWNRTLRRTVRQRTEELQQELAERQRTEELLRKREEEFRTLAENSPDTIIRYDLNCQRVYVNRSFERTTGIPMAEALGPPTESSWHGSMPLSEYQKWLKQVIATGSPAEVFLDWPDKDGNTAHHSLRIVPEHDQQGTITGVLVIGRDITVLNQSQEALKKLNDELEQRVIERTAQLEGKCAELERINKLFVGRELRMVELKERIRELEHTPHGRV